MTKTLYTLPVPSTSLTREAFFSTEGGRFAIRFGYERDGREYLAGIIFSNVAAVRTRAERCCKLQQIESSYDELIELEDSQWVMEVRADMEELWRDKWETKHFMIYIDSAGCYEVIAAGWTVIPEELI
jgi:hypothetical protein